MRPVLLPAIAALVMIPATATAQEWSAIQKEVWAAESACWANRSMETFEGCFHASFVGWGINSTVPTTKADRRPLFERDIATTSLVWHYLKPLAITVHGDMAAVLYIATYTTRDKNTGASTTVTERWTDIMVKDGGRWSWIADHGAVISNP